ncbi:MAG: tyrosine-type recombinase/integrase [Caldivirga sp.]|uniref:tyrosine-type recombinase/integrase n=1 Tax=Caldivirga sp. TaxID=2080243 RepID=UPI003D139B14
MVVSTVVDCRLLDLGLISEDSRRLIADYVVRVKGVRPSDLGVSSSYIGKVRRGVVRVGEGLLCSALKFVTEEELNQLLKGWVPSKEATLADAVKVLATAKANAAFREQFLALFNTYLSEYAQSLGRAWHASESDIEAFIKAKRLKGLSDKTINDEVRYIRLALSELNWVLDPEGIVEYLAGLREDSEHVAKHTAYSLKSFLKAVLKPKDPALFNLLYNSFTTVKPKNHSKVKLPSLEQLKTMFNELPSIEAKAYFLILAETGLRPSEPFLISLSDVDFEHGLIHIGKVTETKRAFVAFLRPESVKWLQGVYLPYRAGFVERMIKPIQASGWFSDDVIAKYREKLIPFEQSRLRREIKETARQVLGREFELYELRKFYATWMISQGVPESIVNTLQGRAPPSEGTLSILHAYCAH